MRASLAAHAPAPAARGSKSAEEARRAGYADEMVALRDEIGEARLEDVPALVAQMERLQGVSLTRADLQTMLVDPASPYFGHLRLREEVRGRGAVERDVLIGRATFVDAAARINIVDWRHAPDQPALLSLRRGQRLRGALRRPRRRGRDRRAPHVTIEGGALTRVACPQGVWVRAGRNGNAAAWQRTDLPTYELAGGQGTATRHPRCPPPSPSRRRRAACWAPRPPAARRWIATCPRSRR